MARISLSATGLTIAAIMSGSNAFTDVARKKAVQQRSLIPVTMWCQISSAAIFGIVLLARLMAGVHPVIRDGGDLFGIAGLRLPPLAAYLTYLAVDVVVVSICNILYFRALQVSPLSLSVPFLAFTPIFLIPTGYLIVGELPSQIKSFGVVLVVVGSLMMRRRLFAQGWAAPAKAILREPGSRYMLIVALLFSISNPLEAKLVTMSDIFTQAFGFGVGLSVFFLVLSFVRKEDCRAALQGNGTWISLAGTLDAGSLFLQYASYGYVDVVIAVSIKRAGILLSVIFGWLFFRERGVRDKMIGTAVMFVGVLIIYLPFTGREAVATAVFALAAVVIAHRALSKSDRRSRAGEMAVEVRSKPE